MDAEDVPAPDALSSSSGFPLAMGWAGTARNSGKNEALGHSSLGCFFAKKRRVSFKLRHPQAKQHSL